MSAFHFPGGAAEMAFLRLVSTSLETILSSTSRKTAVVYVSCVERAGAAPNVTVSMTNGTDTIVLASQRPVAAREIVRFDDGYVLPKGWDLQVMASVANSIDVHCLYVLPQ